MLDLLGWTNSLFETFPSPGFVVELLLGASGLLLLGWLTGAIRYIDDSRVGSVEKLFSLRGSVESGPIALEGRAGYPPDELRGELHFMMPFHYHVHSVPLVTLAQGQIGRRASTWWRRS